MNSSDPSKKLMGKRVIVNHSHTTGTVRGYDPRSKKWWLNTAAAWFSEAELTVLCQ